MSREEITDPEVLADLRRRAETERDPTRARVMPTFVPPAIVEHWPCRGGCGVTIGVTRDAVDARDTFNRQLARRREEPIAKSKIVWCPDCKRRDDELAAAQRRPHEQLAMPGTEPPAQRPSGMPTRTTNRRRSL